MEATSTEKQCIVYHVWLRKPKKEIGYIDIIFKNPRDIWLACCKRKTAVGQSDGGADRLDRMVTGRSSISRSWDLQ
ncbi:hypothetical protein SKAU_G00277490 [Synaphobranchus kaupii]|uniref:Uncharacterized protein n=1 Tax=Synaphobranchus kaupii TaxID=118154 RepID=A0A9Q1EWJ2_SYNKA|nr:hypothetical protein SKAU_G00277490 [Synaphobranchus kaupii]